MDIEQTTRRSRGRPKRYPYGLPVRGTAEEIRTIHTNARKANRSASRFLVELGTLPEGQVLAPRPSEEDLAVLEALMVQLRRVGTNLNQLAHREHASAYTGTEPPTEAEVREVVQAVRELLRTLRGRLA